MKIAIVNKSDARGGAAVVSRRLMHALRGLGAEARMLVTERLTDDPFVELAASPLRCRIPFLAERAEVFAADGFNRADLFKIDPATRGLPLWRHPVVKEADAVLLNWVNQGMLSLEGVARIAAQKPVVWTMHDMWCATGVCHHAGTCRRFAEGCGHCPLLGRMASAGDMSRRTFLRKKQTYAAAGISFVAVSSWLEKKCRLSTLLREEDLRVIPNPFPMPAKASARPEMPGRRITAVMAAARLDEDVKGLPILKDALGILARRVPEPASRLHIIFCGNLRDPEALRDMPVSHSHPGSLPPDRMEEVYRQALLVLSPSRYETLPGTLVEGQAFGALPVAFDRGGQRDIVDDSVTGILAPFGADDRQAASNFADALQRAVGMIDHTDSQQLTRQMRESVESRFSPDAVAGAYLNLLEKRLNC